MPTIAAIENRRSNRRAATAAKLTRQTLQVLAPPPPAPEAATELTATELINLHARLLSLACTDAWADSIIEAVQARRRNGKRLIPYAITDAGTLRTKIPRLLEMIADAMVYPPKADDYERCYLKTGAHHIGSQMMPCHCRDCRGERFWPAGYICDGWISYTCSVNRRTLADDAPENAGRVTMQGASERVIYDPDVWRHDSISKLKIEDPVIVHRLRSHRWSQVVGDSRARLEVRGLGTLGAVQDFIDLGRSLAEVVGVDGAFEVARRLDEYPKNPRRRGVRVIFQKTKTGRRRR